MKCKRIVRNCRKNAGADRRPHGQRRMLSPTAKTKSIISLKRSSIRAPYRRDIRYRRSSTYYDTFI